MCHGRSAGRAGQIAGSAIWRRQRPYENQMSLIERSSVLRMKTLTGPSLYDGWSPSCGGAVRAPAPGRVCEARVTETRKVLSLKGRFVR